MATERLLLHKIPELFNALHLFIFGSTLLVYNVHHLVKKPNTASDLFTWSQGHRIWNLAAAIVGGIQCLIAVFYLPLSILMVCPILAVLSFAYSIPILPFAPKKKLRDFGWIKITVLSSVWTIVTTLLPILYYHKQVQVYPYEIMIRFVFLFILCIAFDIRDMQTDLEARIFTLPNRIGLANSYRLMNGFLILFIGLSFIQYLRYQVPGRFAGEILTALCTRWAISYTRKHPSDKAYLAYIDGMMLLYGILLILL